MGSRVLGNALIGCECIFPSLVKKRDKKAPNCIFGVKMPLFWGWVPEGVTGIFFFRVCSDFGYFGKRT